VDGENQYQMELGNPIRFVDPLGLFSSAQHKNITQGGLSQMGVAQQVIDVIAGADVAQDNGFLNNTGPFSIPANHGDNGRQGIADALKLMNQRWRGIRNAGGEGTCLTCDELRGALEEFGRILHTIQDLYSHSNYIEIMNEQMGDAADVDGENIIPLWPMSAGSDYIPDGVFTGNYRYHGLFGSDPSPPPTHDQLEQMIPDLMSRIAMCERGGTFNTPAELLHD
jgi:hypothetical protein